jgi:hypothetical protein
MNDTLTAFDDQHGNVVTNALAVYAERMRETAQEARGGAGASDPDPANLRTWPAEDLLVLARAAGMLWDSTGRGDPYDVLNDRQRQLMDRAAASYLVAEQGGQDAAEYLRLAGPDPAQDEHVAGTISLRPTPNGWLHMARAFDEAADKADKARAAYETLAGRDDDDDEDQEV